MNWLEFGKLPESFWNDFFPWKLDMLVSKIFQAQKKLLSRQDRTSVK